MPRPRAAAVMICCAILSGMCESFHLASLPSLIQRRAITTNLKSETQASDTSSPKDLEILQQKRLVLLNEVQTTLCRKKEVLEGEIASLEAQRQTMLNEAALEPKYVYEDDDEVQLPSGFDSFPWSEGYKNAVKRAEEREKREGTTRRVALGDIYTGIVALTLGSAVVVGLTAPHPGREQLNYITLAADIEKGTQVFVRLGDAVAGGDLAEAASSTDIDGDVTQLLCLTMVKWSLGPNKAAFDTQDSVRSFRAAISKLHQTAEKGDGFAAKRTYATARNYLNQFIRTVNLSIPPNTSPPIPEVVLPRSLM